MRRALTIVSGGQTGVDRAALDAALAHGVRCGGWCPEGRRAEDGPIPSRYPLTPLPGADYAARTRRNVVDSDGTVVMTFGPPEGGTRLTLRVCVEEDKPHLIVDAMHLDCAAAARRIASFASSLPRGLLNVAGPRASEAPGAYDYAHEALGQLFQLLEARGVPVRATGVGSAPGGDPESGTPPADEGGVSAGHSPGGHSPGGDSMGPFCHSCAAPLHAPGFAGPSPQHCRYCTDAQGRLKKKKVIAKQIAHWMRSWQPDLSAKQARKRAKRYMSAMPEWAK